MTQWVRPADLVITDLFMPNVDGIELIRGLRSEFQRVQIITVSGGGFGGSVDSGPTG